MEVTLEMLKAMEEIRLSGVCNMYDGSYVRQELEDEHGIYVERGEEYTALWNAFMKYKENGDKHLTE